MSADSISAARNRVEDWEEALSMAGACKPGGRPVMQGPTQMAFPLIDGADQKQLLVITAKVETTYDWKTGIMHQRLYQHVQMVLPEKNQHDYFGRW